MFPSEKISRIVANLPKSPGCYLYKNVKGEIIYIGKAKNLSNRVHSYFVDPDRLDAKIARLVPQIADLEFIITDSELEALLLETNLIRKYKPKYNSAKKDDKNYVWLMFETDLDFPRITIVREKKKTGKVFYSGPYPNTLPLKRLLKMLRRVYPYRTCNRKIEQTEIGTNGKREVKIKSSDTKPCLYYYLGLCQAPCAGLVHKQPYRKNISNIKRFFGNEKEKLAGELKEEMLELSREQKFEQAALLRDKLQDLDVISERIHIDSHTDEVVFKEEKLKRREKALSELVSVLDLYTIKLKPGFKMECYDISNIQGTDAVAAMVVFKDGKPAKDLYRKFKIKTKETPDDFEMLREVFRRRFNIDEKKQKDTSFKNLPDLIIVDGGKGQLSATYSVLKELDLELPIIGLAKKHEEIFMPDECNGELEFAKRTLKTGSEARFLIQRIRDEAHRFGIKYHRTLRSKGQAYSELDDIPGVGKVVKRQLLRAFGSIDGIRKASDAELKELIKNKTTVANLRKLL